MRKGQENWLASIALILTLIAMLVLCLTNPFGAKKSEITVQDEAPEETTYEICCESEATYIEPISVFTATETMCEEDIVMLCAEQDDSNVQPYTEDDLFCLAAAIYQEAGAYGTPEETKMLVGNVVLNRVASSAYPNTIREVLEQYGQWGMMWKYGVNFPADAKKPFSQKAVDSAYDCAKRLLEGERVCPDNVVYAAEFKQGNGVHAVSGGIYFCYKG